MKNYMMALTLSVLLAACQQSDDATKDKPAPAADAQANTLIADQDKMSYAIGSNMAESINKINADFAALALNSETVKQGFLETLADKSALNEEQINEQLQVFQQKIQFAQQQKAQESIAAKTAENQVYLEGLVAQGFTKTESGLYYKEVKAGEEGAAKPAATDSVAVNYVGTFTDGSEFDSNAERGPFKFSLTGGVIQGWLEGARLMSVGSKFSFVIPPELGYGFQPRGPIPAGSVLLFDVELLEIEKPAVEAEEE